MRLQTRIWIFVYLTTTQRIHTQESLLFFFGWSRKPSWAVLFSQPDIQKRGFMGDKFPSLSPCEVFPTFELQRHLLSLSGGSLKQYSFPVQVQGCCKCSPHGYMMCHLKQRARLSVICGLCLVILLSHLDWGLRLLTSRVEVIWALTHHPVGWRWDSGGRLPACKPIWLWASYLTQFSPSVKWG